MCYSLSSKSNVPVDIDVRAKKKYLQSQKIYFVVWQLIRCDAILFSWRNLVSQRRSQ